MPNLRNLSPALSAPTLALLAAPVQAGMIFVPPGNVVPLAPATAPCGSCQGDAAS